MRARRSNRLESCLLRLLPSLLSERPREVPYSTRKSLRQIIQFVVRSRHSSPTRNLLGDSAEEVVEGNVLARGRGWSARDRGFKHSREPFERSVKTLDRAQITKYSMRLQFCPAASFAGTEMQIPQEKRPCKRLF